MNIDEQHLQYASAGFLRGLRTLLASIDEIIHKTAAIIGNPSNVDADRPITPINMEVSWNRGTHKSSIYRLIFHSKPSIWGYPHLWNPLYLSIRNRPPALSIAHEQMGVTSKFSSMFTLPQPSKFNDGWQPRAQEIRACCSGWDLSVQCFGMGFLKSDNQPWVTVETWHKPGGKCSCFSHRMPVSHDLWQLLSVTVALICHGLPSLDHVILKRQRRQHRSDRWCPVSGYITAVEHQNLEF